MTCEQRITHARPCGSVLAGVELPAIEARLPRDLADAAVDASEREDLDDLPKSSEHRAARLRAGSLALIGLAVQQKSLFSTNPARAPASTW
jgi:hypothetical protein